MQFAKRARMDAITITARKAAAIARRHQRELDKYPLLHGEIEAARLSIPEIEAQRNLQSSEYEQRLRNQDARVWRESRRDFFRSPAETQDAIRKMWMAWAGPRTPLYYRYCVDQCTGEGCRRIAAMKARSLEIRQAVRSTIGQQYAFSL